MGTASKIGSAGAIVAFGIGLYLGLNMGAPWPITWAVGATLAILLSGTTSATFEYIDARKRYPLSVFGTHTMKNVHEGATVSDCFSCSGADNDGYRVEWSKDEVFAGLITDRHAGGINYYCSRCHADSIEAALRAGKEREFRDRYQGEDHYMDVLFDLRALYLELGQEGDFWTFVEGAMDRMDEAEGVTDPREFVRAVRNFREEDHVRSFWRGLAEEAGGECIDQKRRYESFGWTDHLRRSDPFTPSPDRAREKPADEEDVESPTLDNEGDMLH